MSPMFTRISSLLNMQLLPIFSIVITLLVVNTGCWAHSRLKSQRLDPPRAYKSYGSTDLRGLPFESTPTNSNAIRIITLSLEAEYLVWWWSNTHGESKCKLKVRRHAHRVGENRPKKFKIGGKRTPTWGATFHRVGQESPLSLNPSIPLVVDI